MKEERALEKIRRRAVQVSTRKRTKRWIRIKCTTWIIQHISFIWETRVSFVWQMSVVNQKALISTNRVVAREKKNNYNASPLIPHFYKKRKERFPFKKKIKVLARQVDLNTHGNISHIGKKNMLNRTYLFLLYSHSHFIAHLNDNNITDNFWPDEKARASKKKLL